MTTTAQNILEKALALSPVDRAALIERLFASFDPAPETPHELAWQAEVESRLAAYEAGQLAASPAREVLARLRQR